MSLHELVSRSLKVLDRSDANFRERRQREVRRMPLLRGWMNSCRSRQRAGCLALPLEPRLVERHAEPVFRFGHVRNGGVSVLRSTDDFAGPHLPGKKEEQPARVPRGQSRFPPDLLDLLLPHVQTRFYCIGEVVRRRISASTLPLNVTCAELSMTLSCRLLSAHMVHVPPVPRSNRSSPPEGRRVPAGYYEEGETILRTS